MSKETYIGREVLFRTAENQPVQTGSITKDELPNEHGHPLNIEVQTPEGGTHILSKVDKENVAILVPSEEIHPYWREVLKIYPNLRVATCEACSPVSTTLVNPTNLGRLKSEVNETYVHGVKLYKQADTPAEEKPSIQHSETQYFVGGQEIELPDVVNY